jgi:hypothetical protein
MKNTTNAAHQKGSIITFNDGETWIIRKAIGDLKRPTAYEVAPYGITRRNCEIVKTEFAAEYLQSNDVKSIL